MEQTRPSSVSSYISGFPGTTQKLLKEIRALIRTMAPAAEEMISYGIPAYKWKGRVLVYFAGYKNHLSVYPAPRGQVAFSELDAYKGGKRTVQFPLDEPLPIALIKKIVEHRKKENELKVGKKKTGKRIKAGF